MLSALLVSIVMVCAANPPMDNVQDQTWEGQVSGNIPGPMAATLQTDQADGQTRPVAGKLKITIETTSGGFGGGELSDTLTGTIDDGKLDAEFKGQALVSDGQAPILGRLTGILSNNSGLGTKHTRRPTDADNLSGNWPLHKEDAQP